MYGRQKSYEYILIYVGVGEMADVFQIIYLVIYIYINVVSYWKNFYVMGTFINI